MKIFQTQPIEAPPISQSASGRASNFERISQIHSFKSKTICPEAYPLHRAYLQLASQMHLSHCNKGIKREICRPRRFGCAWPRSRMVEKTNKTGPNHRKFHSIEYHRGSDSKKPAQNLSIGILGDQVCSQANQRLLVEKTKMETHYVAYYRVSTSRQGESGLGLEAQEDAVQKFCTSNAGLVLCEFREVESGTKKDRPALKQAIAYCEKHGAALLIAKLDRLARNVHFVSGLLESGVRFVAVDMPSADRFMMHVYAAVAEEEARRISERTRSALAVARARGVQLGKNGKRLAAEYKREAQSFAAEYGPIVCQLRSKRLMSYRAIAAYLNETQAIPNQRGGKWHTNSVHRLHKRYEQLENCITQSRPHRYRQATAL